MDFSLSVCLSIYLSICLSVCLSMAVQPFLKPLPSFSFLIFYTVGSTPWMAVSARRKAATYTDNTNRG
jgi:hypothetical protein